MSNVIFLSFIRKFDSLAEMSKLLFLLSTIVIAGVANAGVIVMEGHYQNQNIYIQNAISMAGVGFCTYEVTINGMVSTDEIYSDAFEIDLLPFQLEIGTPVMVKIKFKDDGCSPKVLNPNALSPNPTFETAAIDVDNNGELTWTTVHESAALTFMVEQFKWNKWIKVGEVVGKGGAKIHKYNFRTEPCAGVNKFRVKQKGLYGKTRYSPAVSYTSLKSEVTYIYNRTTQKVEFSENTAYELYDMYGSIVKKGHGIRYDVSNLKRGIYYMSYGNTMAEVKKR